MNEPSTLLARGYVSQSNIGAVSHGKRKVFPKRRPSRISADRSCVKRKHGFIAVCFCFCGDHKYLHRVSEKENMYVYKTQRL